MITINDLVNTNHRHNHSITMAVMMIMLMMIIMIIIMYITTTMVVIYCDHYDVVYAVLWSLWLLFFLVLWLRLLFVFLQPLNWYSMTINVGIFVSCIIMALLTIFCWYNAIMLILPSVNLPDKLGLKWTMFGSGMDMEVYGRHWFGFNP